MCHAHSLTFHRLSAGDRALLAYSEHGFDTTRHFVCDNQPTAEIGWVSLHWVIGGDGMVRIFRDSTRAHLYVEFSLQTSAQTRYRVVSDEEQWQLAAAVTSTYNPLQSTRPHCLLMDVYQFRLLMSFADDATRDAFMQKLDAVLIDERTLPTMHLVERDGRMRVIKKTYVN